MRNQIGTIAVMAVVLAGAGVARAQKAAPPPNPQDTTSKPPSSSAEVLDDINKTFGFVPAFLKQMPDTMLATFWYGMKTFQANPNTSLDAKTKELIGVAVAAQIPCEYCIYFHTAAAKKAGASDQDIKEAVGMAAMTRMGSTLLNGAQIDKVQFRKDVDRIMAHDEKSKVQARKP